MASTSTRDQLILESLTHNEMLGIRNATRESRLYNKAQLKLPIKDRLGRVEDIHLLQFIAFDEMALRILALALLYVTDKGIEKQRIGLYV